MAPKLEGIAEACEQYHRRRACWGREREREREVLKLYFAAGMEEQN